MKKDLQNLARKNGQSAKVKAGRVAIMLTQALPGRSARPCLAALRGCAPGQVGFVPLAASVNPWGGHQSDGTRRPAGTESTEQAGTPGGCPYRTV